MRGIGFLVAVAFVIALALLAYDGIVHVAGALIGAPFAYAAHLLLRHDFGRPPIAGHVPRHDPALNDMTAKER